MPEQPHAGAGEGPRETRVTSLDTALNRQRSEELRRVAEDAASRTAALRTAVEARRGGALSFRDQMAVWQETQRTLREMEETARELTAERKEAEREVAEHTAWVRGQVESMLDAGWTRAELAGIGIADEVLAQVGMLDDPRLRGEPDARARGPGHPLPEPGR